MTLGWTLPNRLLIGIFTFSIGSQMNQPCSFQMVWISFQAAFRSARSSVVTSSSIELIDPRFLRRCGFLLADEPVVRHARRSQKFCAFAGSGGTPLCEPKQDGLELQVVPQVRDQRVEVDRRQRDPDADLREIVPDEVGRRHPHACCRRSSSTGS